MNKGAHTDLYCNSCGCKYPEPIKGQIVESDPRAIFIPMGNLPKTWHREPFKNLPEAWNYTSCANPMDPNACFDFVHWCPTCHDKFNNYPLDVIKKDLT